MLIAFFIVCVVVGVLVLLIGTGGLQRRSLPGESHAGKRLVLLGVAVAFAFGLAVPAIVLKENGESQASTAVGVHLSAAEVTGRALFAEKCAVCHTLAATNSVGRIGPILDVRVPEEPTFKAREELVYRTILSGMARGYGNMPARLVEGPEAEDVAKFVAAVAGHK